MRAWKTVLVEALLVALCALVLALLANTLSPRGLRLGRNYFPGAEMSRETSVPAQPAVASSTAEGEQKTAAPNAVDARLARHGLRAVAREQVVAWFREPAYAQGLTVFVDARDDAHYGAGHIPGAWPFNHYRAENYLPIVLPACLGALRVVVYCAGGECEDSEFAAVMLRDAGVPAENLFVYIGGITDWKAHGLPVETGARDSGQMAQTPP